MTSHHPRKRFGQHFLKDSHVLQEMMRCLALQKNDNVIEIGPGLGALTTYLTESLDHLNAVELDRDLITHLQKKFDAKKLTIFSADALDFSYSSLSKKKNDLRIVGNLPYNISTPLLFKLFLEIDCIHDMHFMLQKEVVLRLTAEIGSADYGRLSVMSQYFCDNHYLFDVPPDAFDPPPKVDSAIVRLTPKKQILLSNKQFDIFSTIVKEAFNYRRKKISNSLKRFIDADSLIKINIDPNTRPQDTSLAEFIRISEMISVE
ncbi:MAG: 16S rRNA (adenine(1518)-N(6)/adenine(1519)-N(6))-dimethyltransferase [Gammaproteobacteria bacterium CG_4_10_14_0_8_um_filter_38_16]|nr:MAG: 16S rRNA (adenine(1518)-N(6)/adenine(1519)-N(6))-dimethyltransferase [Gammaproteobacteria bacterium CG_4_10_14_0_8_um_filter_38_16]PJA03165.1 MAG: 16S rRNA (adenine(1518)-N(6)/adenine(1519)-N(6))-dimethyltransferase [Gammaproteobacteria bacterium CG_4_10_14_0_2_um_filter_38_22]PJB09957.1 MAG: 16S rRNA (adenine(1518)-N(6)/adenine(1519)-N(6))-dimethyltransferase [Gammaproteobacteria bacterium CG_4_9_14_3_um_filter_38_9]